MRTVQTICDVGFHISLVLGYTRPLPRVLDSIGEDDVVDPHVNSPHHEIRVISLRPVVCSEDVVAHPVEVFDIDLLTSHGCDLVGSLVPSEESAGLVGPLSSIFVDIVARVCEVGEGRGELRGGVHVSESLELLGGSRVLGDVVVAKAGGVSVLNHTGVVIRDHFEELIIGEHESVEILLELDAGVGVREKLFDVGVEFLDSLSTPLTDHLRGEGDLVVVFLEVSDGVDDTGRGECSNSEVAVLIPEPGGESSRVGTSDGDDGGLRENSVQLVGFQVADEVG